MRMRPTRSLKKQWFFSCCLFLLCSFSVQAVEKELLKVCADPNNLPFSNRQQQGFENKIASLLAEAMDKEIVYTWFPQRMGFIRNTLKAKTDDGHTFKCDLVMGVPARFELTATTPPYYHSSYAFVYAKGRGLDNVHSVSDLIQLPLNQRDKLRIGVFDRTPGAKWLLNHGMIEQIVSYQVMNGDPNSYPGEIIEKDLLEGKLDLAITWGPIAGYFTHLNEKKLVMIPLKSELGVRFDFEIAMGVRRADKQWKKQLKRLIKEKSGAIEKILLEYNVPLLEISEGS